MIAVVLLALYGLGLVGQLHLARGERLTSADVAAIVLWPVVLAFVIVVTLARALTLALRSSHHRAR